MDNIEQVKKEMLKQIKETRERVPPDVLARAQQIAETQLKVQQQGLESPMLDEGKTFWSGDIDFSRFPRYKKETTSEDKQVVYYDRQAAKNIIEHFFTNFDKEGTLLSKFKSLIQKH